jgi:hypothetical protein
VTFQTAVAAINAIYEIIQGMKVTPETTAKL